MTLSRSRAATLAAALLLSPTLGACGFDYATDQIYTQSVGVNDKSGTVRILNAMIVSAGEGSGTFLSTLSSLDTENDDTFTGLGGQVTAEPFEALPVPRSTGGMTNLALAENGAGIAVTGDFKAGQFVTVELRFGSGQITEVQVPVVVARGDFEGLDKSAAADSD
ncbi:hypothetical protein [Nocardioides limicola]|uniref:hypothetical protein n=1 Tax=Nocardioides limicola TaxID=2803368 RepID=UPI00193BA440|nr:hypothetical protein [Nocardioides sp. DJM-14]